MDLKIEVYDCLCELKTFEVNGIEANECDFVFKYDHDIDSAEDYGCGNMACDINNPAKKVLKKYNITEEEFFKIAERVDELVSFGNCGWCN